MINNLDTLASCSERADVLVIGAGTVGLVVSVLLARRGLSVVCLESGGLQQETEAHPYNEVEQGQAPYAGAAEGRFRCLGGTSTRWGGALIPFQPADMDPGIWPLPFSALAAYVEPVEQFFGLDGTAYASAEWAPGELNAWVPRLAKWPPFSKRNVFNLLNAETRSPLGPQVWINATVCEFKLVQGLLHSVRAHAPGGSVLEVSATSCIIAAGAIETTRLTLLLDRQNSGLVSRCSPLLGKGFHDHLSAPVADLVVRDRKRCNRLLGFRFGSGGGMRNLRFELSETTPLRQELPACFAQLTFEGGGGGYAALRDVFRRLQRRKLPTPGLLYRLLAGAPWILRSLWWRLFEQRLLFPDDCRLIINMVIEQQSLPENQISLVANRVDCFGQPLARIDWAVRAADRRNIGAAARAFAAMWDASPLRELGSLQLRPEAEIEAALVTGGGIYHPGGSTRMGASAAEGVVDADLKLFAVPNLRLLSTSVLPTGGGANPTMMLMLLGFRLVDELAGQADARGRPTERKNRIA
jgi:choline dehydrogenase-like flavoprotein